MTTTERVLRYLERQDKWVPQSTFYKLARQHSIPILDMKHALDEVKVLVHIGSEYKNRDTYFRWYKISQKDRDTIANSLAYFDSL